jgi:hypothetical protein
VRHGRNELPIDGPKRLGLGCTFTIGRGRTNQAEIEISLFSRQCLGRRRIPSLGDLRREARAWGRRMNRDRVTIDWRFTCKQARLKFGYKRNQIMRPEK